MKVSGIFFAIVIIAFLMPFMVVKCGDSKIASFSGIKLVTGGKVSNPQLDELQKMTENMSGMENPDTPDDEVTKKDSGTALKPNPYAIIALLAALAGLVSALVLKKGAFLAPVILSVVGLLSLLMLKGPVKSSLETSTAINANLQSMVTVNAQFGYYLAFIGYLLAAVSAVLLGREKPIFFREQLSQSVPDNLANAYGDAKDKYTAVSAGLASKFDDTVDNAKDKFEDTVETVKDKFVDTVETVKDKFEDTVETVKDKFEDTVETVKDKIDTSGIEAKIDAVTDKVKGMVGSDDKITENIDNTAEKTKDKIPSDEDKPPLT